MQNDKSYHEKMKEHAMKRLHKNETFVKDIYIQMVIDEALFNSRKNKLEERINKALDTKNYESFLTLSKEYNKLLLHA